MEPNPNPNAPASSVSPWAQAVPKLTPIDPGFVDFVRKRILDGGVEARKLVGETIFSSMAQVQPGAAYGGSPVLGYLQAEMVIDRLLPGFPVGPNEQGWVPRFGKEAFHYEDDSIAVDGEVPRFQLANTFDLIAVTVHGQETPLDERIRSAAQAMGLPLAVLAAEFARQRVLLGKEIKGATFLTTAGNYTSSETVSTKWSDFVNSDPLQYIVDKRETQRQAGRKRPDTFFCGAQVAQKLQFHPKVTALASYTATQSSPAAPATLDMIAAVLGMNVVVSEAGASSKVGGTVSDIYGKHAGILVVGDPSNALQPRFGYMARSTGYPRSLTYFDQKAGALGSNVSRFLDCYEPQSGMKEAGYLFLSAIA